MTKNILSIILNFIMLFSVVTCSFTVDAASKNTIKTSISKVESKAKGFNVTWKKKNEVKGYQIQYSTTSKFKKSSTKIKNISGAKTNSVTISNLKGCNEKYYVRVRTYKISNGKKVYSAWSSFKKTTTLKHKYSFATCTKAKTCKYCKKTSGKKLGHIYFENICYRCGINNNQEIPVETVLFDKISLSMVVGDMDMLGVTVYPYNATNPTLYWESSNDDIVVVNNGILTAKSPGSATISAYSFNGVYATDCIVIVKSNPLLFFNDFPLHLYSNDGKDYLGKLVTNKYDSDSIWNEYGKYGSKYQTNSIWNEYGKYGSKYQSTSAFNPYASKPPIIVTNSGTVIGYLTASEYKLNGYTIIQLERMLKNAGQ